MTALKSKRKVKRSRRLKVLAALGATVATVGAASPASAGPSNYDQNICGAKCNPHGPLYVLDPLKANVNVMGLPAVVGIQEACAPQFNDFKNFLRSKNGNYYGLQHKHIDATADQCNNAENQQVWFGPGVYVLASVSPHDAPLTTNTSTRRTSATKDEGAFPVQDGGEIRGFACLKGDVFGAPLWGCTAHMKAGDHDALSGPQFNFLYNNVIQPKASSTRIWWGGDFYLTPSELPQYAPGFSYTANREADQCLSSSEIGQYRWTLRADPNLTKVDHSFRSGPSNGNCPTDAYLKPGSSGEVYYEGPPVDPGYLYYSDHRLISGYQP